jgi:hypothetical protein
MKHFHYVLIGFVAVVAAKIARGLLAGWLNVNL